MNRIKLNVNVKNQMKSSSFLVFYFNMFTFEKLLELLKNCIVYG